MSICKQLLLNMCSWNWEKLKFIHKRFLKKSKRPSFFEINIRKKFMVLISWFVSHEDLFGVVRNKLQLLKIYCKSKEDQKFKKRIHHVRSHTYALNFDQWKMLSEKYKPMRVRFWLEFDFDKFTENNCHSWLLSEFIQTQKRYPTSFDKILILTWKLLVISS